MTKTEAAVLSAITIKCGKSNSCITDEREITSLVMKRKLDVAAVKSSVECLSESGYIDTVECLKDGEKCLLITLSERAKNIEKDRKDGKKRLIARLLWAICSAIVTFLAGRLLIYLFN